MHHNNDNRNKLQIRIIDISLLPRRKAAGCDKETSAVRKWVGREEEERAVSLSAEI